MLKYKDTYKVIKVKDKNGKHVNLDDNYIPCQRKGVEIYRYSSDKLAIQFNSNIYAKNRIKELADIGIQLTTLQRGDNEHVYTFKESDFKKVTRICKAKRKVQRNFTDEQKQQIKERLMNAKLNKKTV